MIRIMNSMVFHTICWEKEKYQSQKNQVLITIRICLILTKLLTIKMGLQESLQIMESGTLWLLRLVVPTKIF